MKCPLFILNDVRAQSGEECDAGECLKGECAWWNPRQDQCDPTGLMDVIVTIDKSLSNIAKELTLIRPK